MVSSRVGKNNLATFGECTECHRAAGGLGACLRHDRRSQWSVPDYQKVQTWVQNGPAYW